MPSIQDYTASPDYQRLAFAANERNYLAAPEFQPYMTAGGEWVATEAQEELMLDMYEYRFRLELAKSIRTRDQLVEQYVEDAVAKFDSEGMFDNIVGVSLTQEVLEMISIGSYYAKMILDKAAKQYTNDMSRAK